MEETGGWTDLLSLEGSRLVLVLLMLRLLLIGAKHHGLLARNR